MPTVSKNASPGKSTNFPRELVAAPRWGTWKYDAQKRKVPDQETDQPQKWKAFSQVANAPRKAFLFVEDDPWFSVDLDWKKSATKKASAVQLAIIAKAKALGMYIEPSPSKLGYHLWARCDKTKWPRSPGTKRLSAIKRDDLGIEVYASHRYFTMTGASGKPFAGELPDATQFMLELFAEYKPERKRKDALKGNGHDRDADPQLVRRALFDFCDPEPYREWIEIGQALHDWATQGHDEAFDLWNEWSKKSDEKYRGREELLARWAGFTAGGGITIATLLDYAKPRGFDFKLPAKEEFDAQEIMGNAEVPAHVWGEPANLFDRAGAVAPVFDADDAPSVITDYAIRFAYVSGFDQTTLITSGVVAAAAMIDDRVHLEISTESSWRVSARLWLKHVAGPAVGKSPAQDEMLAPVLLQDALLRFAAEAARKEVEEIQKTGDEILGTKLKRARAAPVPSPSLFTSDATIEKLGDMLRDNPRGLLYFISEFESWLGAHDTYRSGGRASKDRGDWLKLYDGGEHRVDRIGRGSIVVHNWGASILTATTPAVLQKLSSMLPNDGLLQRFIIILVRPKQPRRDDPAGPLEKINSLRNKYQQCITRLHSLEPNKVRLSAEAAALFREYEDKNPTLVDKCQRYGGASFAAHVAKHVTQLARIALVFHCVSTPSASTFTRPLSAATMQMALRFMDKVLRHSAIVYNEFLGGAGDSPTTLARSIAEAILAKDLQTFGVKELRQTCRAFRDAKDAERTKALAVLQDENWIHTSNAVAAYALRIPYGTKWRVNPKCHSVFAEIATGVKADRNDLKAKFAAMKSNVSNVASRVNTHKNGK